MTGPSSPQFRDDLIAQYGRSYGLSDDLLTELLGHPLPKDVRQDPRRMPWPADWFSPPDARTLRAQARTCSELFQTVFLHALRQEAQNALMYERPGCSAESIFLRGWIVSEDGAEVMSLAGFDPADCVSRLRLRIKEIGVAAWLDTIRAKTEGDHDAE